MTTFTFRSPTGAVFQVQAPPGATEAQARAVFERQLNVGSLSSLTPGQVWDSATQATTRLSGGLGGALSQINNKLRSIPVSNGVDAAALLKQIPAARAVGSLDTSQITGLLAQTKLDVNQPFDAVSVTKGIGAYGISPQQLEQTGYLKPGTVQTFLRNPDQLQSVLSSPAVWTGKSGASNLNSLLGDADLQTKAQNDLMTQGLQQLRSAGAAVGNEAPQALGPLLQNTAKFGIEDTLKWTKGAAPANIVTQMDSVAKSAQYSVNFVDTKAPALFGGISLGGATNVTQRTEVDLALASVIGNPKIPAPDFGGGLYSSTPNSELTYDGDDEVVRARINQERANRGLPALAADGGIVT